MTSLVSGVLLSVAVYKALFRLSAKRLADQIVPLHGGKLNTMVLVDLENANKASQPCRHHQVLAGWGGRDL
jgi:hypothetical protein